MNKRDFLCVIQEEVPAAQEAISCQVKVGLMRQVFENPMQAESSDGLPN